LHLSQQPAVGSSRLEDPPNVLGVKKGTSALVFVCKSQSITPFNPGSLLEFGAGRVAACPS